MLSAHSACAAWHVVIRDVRHTSESEVHVTTCYFINAFELVYSAVSDKFTCCGDDDDPSLTEAALQGYELRLPAVVVARLWGRE